MRLRIDETAGRSKAPTRRVGERDAFGQLVEQEVERVDRPHLEGQLDQDVEGADRPVRIELGARDVVAVGILLPAQAALRLDRQAVAVVFQGFVDVSRRRLPS